MDSATIKRNVDEIFQLFEKFGREDYIGEPISKTEHSIQCGMLAEETNAAPSVILGAFLHDIGHLIGAEEGKKEMVFQGFPREVTDIVRAHVLAKKYLCFKDKPYYDKLSWASKRTLEFQGGPMSEKQAEHFEEHPHFPTFITMRSWDEAAKDPELKNLKDLNYFKKMASDYLASIGSVSL